MEIDTAKLQIKGASPTPTTPWPRPLATLRRASPRRRSAIVYAFAPCRTPAEPVAEKDGVLWINDSKATNVDSVYYALESRRAPWCGSPAGPTRAT